MVLLLTFAKNFLGELVPERFAVSIEFHVAGTIWKVLLDTFVKMWGFSIITVRFVEVGDFWLDFLCRICEKFSKLLKVVLKMFFVSAKTRHLQEDFFPIKLLGIYFYRRDGGGFADLALV